MFVASLGVHEMNLCLESRFMGLGRIPGSYYLGYQCTCRFYSFVTSHVTSPGGGPCITCIVYVSAKRGTYTYDT